MHCAYHAFCSTHSRLSAQQPFSGLLAEAHWPHLGTLQVPGDGEGDGPGEGEGDGPGEGDGDGAGEGEGEGEGAGEGEEPGMKPRLTHAV